MHILIKLTALYEEEPWTSIRAAFHALSGAYT